MTSKIIATYSLLLGLSVIASWIMILATGEIPEGPKEFSFHLSSELIMSLGCIAGGFLMLKNHPGARSISIAGHAMVIYSVLNAAGYYAERGQVVLPLVFLILFLLSLLVIGYLGLKKH